MFRLPVGVQPDGPKHITPAPNQYNVCTVCDLHKLLLEPLFVHPAVDKHVYVFSVLDRSVVEAVVRTDSPQWLARQRSCPKLDVTLFIQTIICHRRVSTYLNSLFYLLDILLTVLFSHQTC